MHFRTLFSVLLLGAVVVASTSACAASYGTATQNGNAAPLSSTEISSQSVLLSTVGAVTDSMIDMVAPVKDVKVEQARAYDAASFSSVTDGISLKPALVESNAERSHSVPLPSAVWLFGSALLGFVTMSNRRRV
jgi:hypothetical protein